MRPAGADLLPLCLLPASFTQLSEALANFLPGWVTVETERPKGPGKSHPQAREITGEEEDNASSGIGPLRAVNRKTPGFHREPWPRCAPVALARLSALSQRSSRHRMRRLCWG